VTTSRSLRILIISNLYPPLVVGGAELIVERHAQILRSRGHEVAVLTTNGKVALRPRKSESSQNDIRVIRIPSPNVYHFIQRPAGKLWRAPWAMFDAVNPISAQVVRSLARQFGPNVVVTSNLWNLSTSIWTAAARVAPVMHVLHDGSSICLTGHMVHKDLIECFGTRPPCSLLLPIRRRQSQSVSLVVAPSHFLLQRTKDAGLFRGATHRKIANPRTDEAVPAPSTYHTETKRPLRVAFIGQLAPHKGPHILAEMIRATPGIELHVMGTGDASLLAPLHGVPGRLFLHGWLPSSKRNDVLSTCDILALPSLCLENHPGVVVTSHQLGLPVISFAVGGVPEMVMNEVDGLLVPPFDRRAFRIALIRLRDDRDLVRSMSAAARKRYLRYSRVPHEEQFVDALEDLANDQ
jgi:glycosyltransferase involved in cell wall biosynthesis